MANQTLAKLETLCRKGGMIGEGQMREPLGFEAMEPEVKVSEVGRRLDASPYFMLDFVPRAQNEGAEIEPKWAGCQVLRPRRPSANVPQKPGQSPCSLR
jgi:hypothetical protein